MNDDIPEINENTEIKAIPLEVFEDKIAESRVNNFVGKYKGWMTLIISVGMIALIVYLILNIQLLKTNAFEYCTNVAKCVCIK